MDMGLGVRSGVGGAVGGVGWQPRMQMGRGRVVTHHVAIKRFGGRKAADSRPFGGIFNTKKPQLHYYPSRRVEARPHTRVLTCRTMVCGDG